MPVKKPKLPRYVSVQTDLKAWRTKLGISQREAAHFLRVSRRTYQGWEAGRAPIGRGMLLKAIESRPTRDEILAARGAAYIEVHGPLPRVRKS